MTTLPAVVTIQDLPTGTTLTGAELLEAVQTAGGVADSIQVTVSQIMSPSLGALPTGGGTGQILQKSNASNFAATWGNIASAVLASTGLAQSGSTTVSLSLASTAGLSVLAVAATGSAVPAAIVGTGAQVLRVNDAGTALGFGALNLASSAAVTGVLPGANFSAVNLSASGPGGVQNVLQAANVTAINLASSGVAGGVQGILPVSNGGQGTSTLTLNGVLFGNGTSKVGITAQGATGTLLSGNNGVPTFTGSPTLATSLAIGTTGSPPAGGLLASGFFNSGGFTRASASTSVATTTLTNIAGLSVSLLTANTYQFEAVLFCTAGSTGGTKIAIGYTGTATNIVYDGQVYGAGAFITQARATAVAGPIPATSAVTPTFRVVGLITAANAGTLTTQLAQVASTTTSTIALAGSYMNIVQLT